MTISRDLFLMSALAFENGKFEQAGQLFAACLSSNDTNDFLTALRAANKLNASTSADISSEQVGKRPMLTAIGKKITIGMAMASDVAATQDEEKPDDFMIGQDLSIDSQIDSQLKLQPQPAAVALPESQPAEVEGESTEAEDESKPETEAATASAQLETRVVSPIKLKKA